MRFVVDECTGPVVARWLREQSHEVYSVYDEARGTADDDILDMAHSGGWILITNDKDFGLKIYREKRPHRGFVFLRLKDERPTSKINAIRRLLDGYGSRLANAFVVVTEKQIRFGPESQ